MNGRRKDAQFSVEGDGILENFYPLLWAKDPVFGTSITSFSSIFTGQIHLTPSTLHLHPRHHRD